MQQIHVPLNAGVLVVGCGCHAASGGALPWPGLLQQQVRWSGVPAPLAAAGAGLPAVSVPQFGSYAAAYIDGLDHVNGYTRRRYRAMLREHVVPELGSTRVDEISFVQLQAWQRGKTGEGLSRKTIANIRGGIIVPALKAACRPQADGSPPLRTTNPAEGLRLPPGRRRRRDVITSQEEIKVYLASAYEVDSQAADLLLLGLVTGMRWGDLAGLRCRDIDVVHAEIRPSQVLARGGEHHDRWELREHTKSIAGDERVIPVPWAVMPMLRRRVEGRLPDDLVFTAPMGGPWDHSRFRERRYLPILRLAQQRGLRQHITPHALRTSLLTMLADEGADPKVMQHIAGHESLSTLYDSYVRSTRRQRRQAADCVEGFLPTLI